MARGRKPANRPERGKDSFSSASAIRQQTKRTRTRESNRLAKGMSALARLREEAAVEIERLIGFLDETEPDPDLEDDGDDEPSLGSIEDHPNPYRDGTDYPGCGRDQSRWAGGSTDDREGDEHDGREPDDDEGGEAEREDCEPSLGWTTTEACCGRYAGAVAGAIDLEEDAGSMREIDPAENGVADSDGLLEQCGGLYPNGIGTVAAYARAVI